jgi:hypothetical protein
MRTTVSFRHPAEFVPLSDEDGILAVSGAQWFVYLLRHVPDLAIDDALCQEDWGVEMFAQRGATKFWIGLSAFGNAWIAHVRHRSFAWLQRLSSSGKSALECLLVDIHRALTKDPSVSDVVWYDDSDLDKSRGFATPT